MYSLPSLSYSYDALSRAISSDIMELHHKKHHQTYVDKLNTALESASGIAERDLESILTNLDAAPESVQAAIRNNGGGHLNHSMFWQWMSPDGGGAPTGVLAEKIAEQYGDFQQFVDVFSEKATSLFGSGWVWLQPDLEIITTPNQDNPIMNGQAKPILGLDVWEHAYYLDYKNVRADYIKAWWDVVHWDAVNDNFTPNANQ